MTLTIPVPNGHHHRYHPVAHHVILIPTSVSLLLLSELTVMTVVASIYVALWYAVGTILSQ